MSLKKFFMLAVTVGLVLVLIGLNTQPAAEPVPTPTPTPSICYECMNTPLFQPDPVVLCERGLNEGLALAGDNAELAALAITLYGQCLAQAG